MKPAPVQRPSDRPVASARLPVDWLLGLLLLWSVVALPGSAAGQLTVSASGGHFEPWVGSGGFEARGSILYPIGTAKRFRVGGELAYRKFKSEFFRVSDVDVDSYRVGGIFHFMLVRDFFLQPYLGAKINLGINVIDDDQIEAARPDLEVDGLGASTGVGGIAGLDIALGDHFALFGEVVVSVDAQFTDTDGNLDVENLGGVSGVGGLRVKF